MLKYLLLPCALAAGGIYSKHITKIQKHEAFIKYICGYSPQELANELNVHFTTVYRWINDWQKDLSCRKLTDLSIQDIGEILTYTEELRQQLIAIERSTAIIHESKVMQIIPMEQRIDMAVSLLDRYILCLNALSGF